MKFKFKNGWRSPSKQWDKIEIVLRLSYFTLFALKYDRSSDKLSIAICNFIWKKEAKKV